MINLFKIVGFSCLILLSCTNGDRSRSDNATKQKSQNDVQILISNLLSQSNTERLTPGSINNLDIIFGFRGLKMNMNINEIRFDKINTNQYKPSFSGEWDIYESDLGYTDYSLNVSKNTPYSLADTPIKRVSLMFIDDELAQIVLGLELYESAPGKSNNNDILAGIFDRSIKENEYERLINTLISTFGKPTIPEFSDFYTQYYFNENQDLPVELEVKTLKNEWRADSIKLVLNNNLQSKKVMPGETYYGGGSVSLVYTSLKYESRINRINSKREESMRKYYIEENLRRQMGDF